jgi:mRNA interferase MazF
VVRRGDVWWVDLPDEKPRPYVVLTRDEAIDVLNTVVAVAVSTVVRNIPTEVSLDESDGMPRLCAASLDNLRTLPKWAFSSRITALSAVQMERMCAALHLAVHC